MSYQPAIADTLVPLAGGLSELGAGTPVGVFFFAIGCIALWAGVDRYRKSALVRNTPTERVQSIALGRTEVVGRCSPAEESFSAPFTDDNCVYASWSIKEYNSRKGGWELREKDSIGVPFYIEDETGQVLVENPRDATVSVTETKESTKTVRGPDSLDDEIVEFCEQTDISPTSQDGRQYVQEIVPAGEKTYVFGEAEHLDNPASYESENDIRITRDTDTGEFILADDADYDLANRYRTNSLGYVFWGLLMTGGGLAMVLYELGQTGLLW